MLTINIAEVIVPAAQQQTKRSLLNTCEHKRFRAVGDITFPA